jgi:hypothetical protein
LRSWLVWRGTLFLAMKTRSKKIPTASILIDKFTNKIDPPSPHYLLLSNSKEKDAKKHY